MLYGLQLSWIGQTRRLWGVGNPGELVQVEWGKSDITALKSEAEADRTSGPAASWNGPVNLQTPEAKPGPSMERETCLPPRGSSANYSQPDGSMEASVPHRMTGLNTLEPEWDAQARAQAATAYREQQGREAVREEQELEHTINAIGQWKNKASKSCKDSIDCSAKPSLDHKMERGFTPAGPTTRRCSLATTTKTLAHIVHLHKYTAAYLLMWLDNIIGSHHSEITAL